MKKKISVPFFLLLLVILVLPLHSHAQSDTTSVSFTENFEKARVLEITNEEPRIATSSSTPAHTKTLRAEILDGPDKGQIVAIDNVRSQLSVGDMFYARHLHNQAFNTDFWSVASLYRLNVLAGLALIFIMLIFFFGGIQGVRGLASLVGSFILIFYILIPSIYAGFSAIAVSIGVSSLIIVIGSYVTHGFNKTTTAAVVGMILTVIITGLGAYYVVHAAHLSGYTSEEAAYLNLNTKGAINMVGLLFGGLMIGLLGVLYDIAIGQAIAVEELFRAGKHLTRLEIYRRAIRIGREHIGALVNTLAIVYVGASLPLLLLLQNATTGVSFIINDEMFATEIVRILIGSIGLILGVPITTIIASHMLSEIKEGQPHSSHGHVHR